MKMHELVYDEKGFKCECGEYYPHPAYVIAHWSIELVHTCSICGREHSILGGNVSLISESVAKKEVLTKNR
jgi:hypothetical protein